MTLHDCKQEKIKHQMKCFSWPDYIKDTDRDYLSLIFKSVSSSSFSSFFIRFLEIIQSSVDDKT